MWVTNNPHETPSSATKCLLSVHHTDTALLRLSTLYDIVFTTNLNTEVIDIYSEILKDISITEDDDSNGLLMKILVLYLRVIKLNNWPQNTDYKLGF